MAFTRELYKLGFEISPVILCDGIAQSIPGGMLPIVALTQSASFVTGLLGGAMELTDLDKYFCHWRAAQGATGCAAGACESWRDVHSCNASHYLQQLHIEDCARCDGI